MSGWASIDPIVYRQGWDAALAGKPTSVCDFFGTGPRAAWHAGYADALAEREKDVSTGSPQETGPDAR